MTSRLLRAAAWLVAIAGVFDFAVTSTRRVKPELALIATDAVADTTLVERVARSLEHRFAVIRGPFDGAAAVVAVGTRVPALASRFQQPAFAVMPDEGPAVAITSVAAPPIAHVDAAQTVVVDLIVERARDRQLVVSLRRGDVTVDRVTRTVASDLARHHEEFSHVPTEPGVAALSIVAELDGTSVADRAVVAVDTRIPRPSVLFFDRRPSWTSTFVRRAVERDSRLAVSSRVVTSREAGIDRGSPPEALTDLAALVPYGTIVVGAAEELAATELTALMRYMKERGGTVVLLLDRSPAGRPTATLLGATGWAGSDRDTASALHAPGSDAKALRASELVWPEPLPPGATPLVIGDADAAVIWRRPIGMGQVVVSGALDAWRFRADDEAAFDRYWRSLVADAAVAAPRPIEAAFSPAVVEPSGTATLHVRVRDASLRDTVAPEAPLAVAFGSHLARLWRGTDDGFSGTVAAPAATGAHSARIVLGNAETIATLIVMPGATHAAANRTEMLTAWATSRGGEVIPASQLAALDPALDRVVSAVSRSERWHPMRSPWWIVPFALALGVEWWTRRREGLR